MQYFYLITQAIHILVLLLKRSQQLCMQQKYYRLAEQLNMQTAKVQAYH